MSAAARPALRWRALWLAVGWGFVAVVVYLSLNRDPVPVPDVGFKLGHVLAYAWLMFWWTHLVSPGRARLLLALALVALGVGLEFAQDMTSYRHFSVDDMRDDAIGVIAGWLCALSPLGRILPAIDRALART